MQTAAVLAAVVGHGVAIITIIYLQVYLCHISYYIRNILSLHSVLVVLLHIFNLFNFILNIHFIH